MTEPDPPDTPALPPDPGQALEFSTSGLPPLVRQITVPAGQGQISATPDTGDLAEGRFSGRVEFQARVLHLLRVAGQQGWRELILCDASFADWPLAGREPIGLLQAWSGSGRRFGMIARRYDELARQHHRFVQWRRQWSHIIDCRACPSADPSELPSLIWSPHWVLQRLDPVRNVGICTADPSRVLALKDALDDWYSKSTPGFAATTLGL